MPLSDFLSQGLGEPVHAELREVVDAVAAPGDPAGDRADVDNVGYPARAFRCGLEQVRQRGASGVEQPLDVDGNQRDGGTLLGELAGGGGTDTTARARDQSGGAGQFRRRCHASSWARLLDSSR
jgi:hypothetical protein